MKRTIRRSLYAGLIVFASVCLYLGGCQKKLVRGDKLGEVEGYVKNSTNLIPIFQAQIFVDDYPVTQTDSTGYYRAGSVLQDRRLVKITVKALEYTTQEKTIILKASQLQRLDFFLVKEGAL